MRKQGIDGTGMLNLYDRVTGIFNEIFDSRLLTAAIFALIGYCSLFTQRKFPMRWMIFVLFGMILLAFVTLTARTPGQKARVHFHKGMAGLWFALHGMMVVSGLFYEDWLPESVPLLVCYPIVFSVFVSRDDDSTFRSILRGAVFAVLPFLAWSYAAVPLSFAYPGYKGVFYDANCLSMCCIVMATAALLLAYASFMEKRMKAAAAYLLLGVWAAATLLATLSRSGLLAFAGVMVILVSAIIAGTAKHPARLLALVAAFIVLCGAAGVKITKDKMYEAAVEDYNLAVYNHETYGNPITVPKPEDRTISMDDLTSDRWGIWMTILGMGRQGRRGRPPLQRAQCVFRRGLQQRLHRRPAAGRLHGARVHPRPAVLLGAPEGEPLRRDAAGVLHGVHSGGHVRIGLRAVLNHWLCVLPGADVHLVSARADAAGYRADLRLRRQPGSFSGDSAQGGAAGQPNPCDRV